MMNRVPPQCLRRVVRVTGGKRGGGASLTETGRTVLEIFRSVETRARLLFAGDVDALSLLLDPAPAGAGCDALEAGPGSADCRARKLRKQRPAPPPLGAVLPRPFGPAGTGDACRAILVAI